MWRTKLYSVELYGVGTSEFYGYDIRHSTSIFAWIIGISNHGYQTTNPETTWMAWTVYCSEVKWCGGLKVTRLREIVNELGLTGEVKKVLKKQLFSLTSSQLPI